MSEINREGLSELAKESSESWAREAESDLTLAKISSVGAIAFGAASGYAAAKGWEMPTIIGITVSGAFAVSAINEVREAMKLNRKSGFRSGQATELRKSE